MIERGDDGDWTGDLVEAVRDICYEGQDLPHGVQYTYCDDEKYATIKIDEVENAGRWIGCCLYVQWYKTRAYTDALWILGRETPREPTEPELLAIVDYYKALSNEG